MPFILRFIVIVTIDFVIVSCDNGRGNGLLTQAGLKKKTERDPRQHRPECECSFRRHARDENGLIRATQAFLLQFCNEPMIETARLKK
jgi:hypothetical protein